MTAPTYAEIPYRSKAKSAQLNQILQALSGVNDTASGLPWATTPNGRWAWTGPSAALVGVRNSGALSSMLSVVGESSEGQMTLMDNTSGVSAAAAIVPQFLTERWIIPNGTVVTNTETGSNILFKVVRRGTGAAGSSNGNLAAMYHLGAIAYDDSSYSGFSGGHDLAGLAGIVKILDSPGGVGGSIRGGTVASTARGYALYTESEVLSQVGQAFGAEIQVVNSSNTTAHEVEYVGTGSLNDLYRLKNYGIQIVSQLNASLGDGLATRTLSSNNTAAIFITTSDAATAAYKFLRGIIFNTASVKDYAIDTHLLATSPMLIANAQAFLSRNALNSLDVKMMRLAAADTLDIFAGHTGAANANIRFVTQAGTVLSEIDPTSTPAGLWKNTNGQTIVLAGGAGSTLGLIGWTAGAAGMPTSATLVGFKREQDASGNTIWLPYYR